MRGAAFFSILLVAFAAVAAGEANLSGATKITADRMLTENEKGLIRFVGNVEATHKDINLKADEVEVYSNEKKEAVTRIIATGNVVVTKGDRRLTGGRAELDYDLKRVVLTGNPTIDEKGNSISGEKIVYQYDKEGIIIDGGAQKKATLILPMADKEKEKEKEKGKGD
jgi:lipopolysaccharide export system protein LptA